MSIIYPCSQMWTGLTNDTLDYPVPDIIWSAQARDSRVGDFIPKGTPDIWVIEIREMYLYFHESYWPIFKSEVESVTRQFTFEDDESARMEMICDSLMGVMVNTLKAGWAQCPTIIFGCLRDWTAFIEKWAGYVMPDGSLDRDRAALDELARRWSISP